MDFLRISERTVKKGVVEIYPEFIVNHSKDLMVRGSSFYAIWDADNGIWSTDTYVARKLIDDQLLAYFAKAKVNTEVHYKVKLLQDFSSGSWNQFNKYISSLSDNYVQLDERLTFQNTLVRKDDYVSRKLPYSLSDGECSAWDELIGVLYKPEERRKLEWAIGAIISGDSRTIQKFVVFYGSAGTGKSTVLNILEKLFQGYYTVFDAKSLGMSSSSFALETFKSNPLVAIQHDGDLSRIEDNTKLNSVIAHEEMVINEKFKSMYYTRLNAFLFLATNRAVKITDARSGLIRRLIDISPTGKKIESRRYQSLMGQIQFELGAIAQHCLEVYLSMGKHYYDGYRPLDMMYRTDFLFNFVDEYYDYFSGSEVVTLKKAYQLYKEYCVESLTSPKQQYLFRDELRAYFQDFKSRAKIDGVDYRSAFIGFDKSRFLSMESNDEPEYDSYSLVMDSNESIFDELAANYPAQYATDDGTPSKRWDLVQTTLKDIDTTKLHYVRVPENHIVIDFDITDEDGQKDPERNLAAASEWPPTYAEYSKSGGGIHLHYIYSGDVEELNNVFEPGIEIKVFSGKSSLRRKLSLCNNVPVATLDGGLPLKEKKVINTEGVKDERHLRNLIAGNLDKEYLPGTKPSIDFIFKLLDDAYKSGMHYDVSDLRPKVLAFANNSTNHSEYCVRLVSQMHFASEEVGETTDADGPIVFFDVEVFPNLFVVCWKYQGADKNIVNMINPTPEEIEELLKMKLVGFNNRRYDNHILYARYMGYSNLDLFKLSQKIVKGVHGAMFGEAYGVSYADIYDFSSKKQSLKKFEVELGIHHKELGLPWDKPVDESLWLEVVKYCNYDIQATEAVFEARKEDFEARKLLSELSGLSVNDSTRQHATRIIFQGERNTQQYLEYTDLSEMFPGYTFVAGKSSYKGEDPGEGGYVYAEPGIYHDVALLDVASMHPTSIEQLNLFGPFTKNFSDLKSARIAVKHHDVEALKELMDGKLVSYLTDDQTADKLSYALKIIINSIYGYTAAAFENPFRDVRNKDNIVAKRGALFMIDLKNYVQSLGYTVAHIKTDSIKIPNADEDIIEKVKLFGRKYGYEFEHEATYEKMCLVNDAVYIAKHDGDTGQWEAVGAQFQHPYVFNVLFNKAETILPEWEAETRSVSTAMYLDFNENLPEGESNRIFVGKVGRFIPVRQGTGGGLLLREKDGKYYAVTGTKGYRWKEFETLRDTGSFIEVDDSYFETLAVEAINTISEFGDAKEFIG